MSTLNDNIFVTVYLGLGTNLGNKEQNIEIALENIKKQIGKVISLSAFHVSEPFGFASVNMFLNCAVGIETALSPNELLAKTQQIEQEMGRLRKSDAAGYSDRIIDIDILFYGDSVIEDAPTLIIPHQHIQERDFVLNPLVEIAPDWVHPVLGKTITELVHELKVD